MREMTAPASAHLSESVEPSLCTPQKGSESGWMTS
jgi:hypothetical protein